MYLEPKWGPLFWLEFGPCLEGFSAQILHTPVWTNSFLAADVYLKLESSQRHRRLQPMPVKRSVEICSPWRKTNDMSFIWYVLDSNYNVYIQVEKERESIQYLILEFPAWTKLHVYFPLQRVLFNELFLHSVKMKSAY